AGRASDSVPAYLGAYQLRTRWPAPLTPPTPLTAYYCLPPEGGQQYAAVVRTCRRSSRLLPTCRSKKVQKRSPDRDQDTAWRRPCPSERVPIGAPSSSLFTTLATIAHPGDLRVTLRYQPDPLFPPGYRETYHDAYMAVVAEVEAFRHRRMNR